MLRLPNRYRKGYPMEPKKKLVLNINLYARSKIFELVRVSYLLANSKAVVADIDDETMIENDVRSAIRCANKQTLLSACQSLVSDDAARLALENAGHAVIVKRDIRGILECALG